MASNFFMQMSNVSTLCIRTDGRENSIPPHTNIVSRGGGEYIWVSYFSMRNPHMKFQNPSMHGSQDINFILIFTKGQNSRKGDNLVKKKKRVSAIFP